MKMFPWLQLWKRYWSRVNLGEREAACLVYLELRLL